MNIKKNEHIDLQLYHFLPSKWIGNPFEIVNGAHAHHTSRKCYALYYNECTRIYWTEHYVDWTAKLINWILYRVYFIINRRIVVKSQHFARTYPTKCNYTIGHYRLSCMVKCWPYLSFFYFFFIHFVHACVFTRIVIHNINTDW